jgi:hypothetical protein
VISNALRFMGAVRKPAPPIVTAPIVTTSEPPLIPTLSTNS